MQRVASGIRASSPPTQRWLDRPVLSTVTLNWEKGLYGLLIALAILTRLWDLGYHILSHDEMVHAQWSWYLYKGHGYGHTPLSHGPFLFHGTALFFYLFGDNEFTARLVPAILGILLVALPYAFRRWLGRAGALVTAFLFLISPSLLYYSRYARNDVPIVVWALLAVLATFRYLDNQPTNKPTNQPLLLLSAALSLMFATKEVSFFYIAILGLFLVLLFFARLGTSGSGDSVESDPTGSGTLAGQGWAGISLTVLGLIGVVLLATVLLLFSFYLVDLFPIRYRDCGQAPTVDAATGEMQCVEGGCQLLQGRCQRPIPVIVGNVAEFDQTGTRVAIRLTYGEVLISVILISAVALLTAGGVYVVLERWMPFRGPSTNSGCSTKPVEGPDPVLDLILVIGSFVLPFLSHVAISGLSRLASRLFFGIDAAFNSLDYGEAGLLRSLGFVFILLAVSITVGLWWDRRRWLPAAGVFYGIFVVLFTTVFTNGNGIASGLVGSLGYWLEQQAVERGSQPLYYYGLMVPLYEYLPLIGFIAALFYAARRGLTGNKKSTRFMRFVFFWLALTWPIYTAAGERMPWMTVHFVPPLALASGWVIGKLIEGTDWHAVLGRQGRWLFIIAPLGWAALVQTVSPWLGVGGAPIPFTGHSLRHLNVTLQFTAAALVLAGSVGALYWVWQRIGAAAFQRALALLTLGVLATLTIRTAWAFAYTHPDSAGEFLVYAHGAPDVRLVMERVKEISQRTSGDLSLEIGYTGDGSYPLIWYLRNYPNAVRLPNPPGRPDLDKPVLLVGDQEWGGIEPYLGERYACNRYNVMWWPLEDYRDLSWERIRYALFNPTMRAALWDIVFRRDYRRYEQASGKVVRLSQWPMRDRFRFCVRRDVLAGLWGAGDDAVTGTPKTDTGLDSYVHLEQPIVAGLEVKGAGAAWGGLNNPHGMALGADGSLYVADTDNHRIVKFSPDGELLDTWDSTWWHGLSTWQPNGCLDAEGRPLAWDDGEFCEPWGVAVGPSGRVYVADTWNHRVQVFDAEGQFLSQVGTFGQSGSDPLAMPGQFYGPRDVAVDREGYVYVSDTGNKRVQVFDADLKHQFSFGGPGLAPGQMDEPVGLAVGPDDLLYVADTWNRRVQVLTRQGSFIWEWSFAGWEPQSAFNKPYIAVDSAGRVYLSDPEGLRVVAFDALGRPLAALRGGDGSELGLPSGVLLDAQDRLWVSDAATQRLLRFPPLSLEP